MRRRATYLFLTMAVIIGIWAVNVCAGSPPSSPGVLKAISVTPLTSGAELAMNIEGDYAYQTVQATETSLFVDLKGVRSRGVAKEATWREGLLEGYRLLPFLNANGQPMVRVLVESRHQEPVQVRKTENGLVVAFGSGTPLTKAPPAPAVQPAEALAPSPAPAGGTLSSGPTLVSGIAISEPTAGTIRVEISTDRPSLYRVFQLPNPARLVIDLEGARVISRKGFYPAASPLLKSVRVSQFKADNPAVVRVVADLVGSPKYDVSAQANGIRLELQPSAQTAASSSAPPTAVKSEERVVSPAAAGSDSEAAAASQSQKPPVTAGRAGSRTPSAKYHDVLPAATKDAAAAPRPAAPVVTPESLRAAAAAKILAASNSPSAGPQSQGPPPPPPLPGQEESKYTGESISLNLKDVDLKDFFRLIHEISGLNIILDPNVAGAVTLVLEAVPWDQALDIVLKNHRLGKTLEGNVLRIARLETLTSEQEAAARLAAARDEAAALVTVFRPVNYAKAASIATLLKSWVGGGALTKRGTILVDERTNTLIVSDIQPQIPVIESIIEKLDKKAKQVSIEARIVRANADFTRNLQAALAGAYNNRSGSTVMAGATGPPLVSAVTDGSMPMVNTTTASGFGVVAVSNAGARYIINAAIAAAEQRSQAKTISRPTIVTQNNVMGEVQQGTQIPIQTTINNTISITYVNATLQLRVTPQVTEDGNIFLTMEVRNASPGAALTIAGPSINTQQASTQVMVPDGGTVVFGGVQVTQRSKSYNGVPVLGSIPLLGSLFRSSTVQDTDQELLFFVSPKVLPG